MRLIDLKRQSCLDVYCILRFRPPTLSEREIVGSECVYRVDDVPRDVATREQLGVKVSHLSRLQENRAYFLFTSRFFYFAVCVILARLSRK